MLPCSFSCYIYIYIYFCFCFNLVYHATMFIFLFYILLFCLKLVNYGTMFIFLFYILLFLFLSCLPCYHVHFTVLDTSVSALNLFTTLSDSFSCFIYSCFCSKLVYHVTMFIFLFYLLLFLF